MTDHPQAGPPCSPRSLRRLWVAVGLWILCCAIVIAGVVLMVEWNYGLGVPVLTLGVIAGTGAVHQVDLECQRLKPPAEG